MAVTEAKRGAVGTSVHRRQDPRLLRGCGTFVADVKRPGMLHMAVLRSGHAHARIRRLDGAAARGLQGVFAVITGADIAARVKALPVLREGKRLKGRDYPVLPTVKAIYVGQPLAVVVAESRALAEDAVERIEIDYEPLPVVATMDQALVPGAPLIHEAFGDNRANSLVHEMGDVAGALAASHIVRTRRFRIARLSALPLEGRGVVAEYDRALERLTLWYSSQAPHLFRTLLAQIIGFPEHRIHVITREVGGGFGMKLHYFPEEVLAALASLDLGRPVKWIEDRMESFVGSTHAREQVIELTVGATREGKLTAARAKIMGDVGAHLHTKGASPIGNTCDVMTGGYDIPNYAVDMVAVFTNKMPFGAYRGFGAPQAFIAMEGMLDLLAAELGVDAADIRLRNLLRPDQFPHTTPLGAEFDSGNYPEVFRLGLRLADYAGLRARQAEQRRRGGKLLGIGISFPIEIGGQGPCKEMRDRLGILQGGYESATVRVDTTGKVTVASGIMDTGQGVNTALAQICADALGVPVDDVEVVLGDTERTPYSAYGNAGHGVRRRCDAPGGPGRPGQGRPARCRHARGEPGRPRDRGRPGPGARRAGQVAAARRRRLPGVHGAAAPGGNGPDARGDDHLRSPALHLLLRRPHRRRRGRSGDLDGDAAALLRGARLRDRRQPAPGRRSDPGRYRGGAR
jgi:carbon-monoxide dehydrogenase large subunit